MSGAGLRVGVDVGGTFTDVITYDADRDTVHVGKRLTDAASPANGVLDAVAGVAGERLGGLERFAHGTTIGLNALLQRRGAVVGLLCTEGFRDVLEIRRGTREDAFDLGWAPPPPLVPRRRRLAVRERMRADGAVHLPLDEEGVTAALRVLREAGVDSIAVAFLNAWANPAHEQRAGELLREAGFDGEITLSHELSRQYREFERTSTAVVNAFIRPPLSRYLRTLGTELRARSAGAALEIMRSGGGTMSFEEAEVAPFEAIFSGPVAGAEAVARLAGELGLEMAICADVGGTSFDTCLILDGGLPLLQIGTAAGFPVQSSWVDVRSIGAGGGSIAWVDAGGLLRVGPHSAGSSPGPAAYGRGGSEPTVTDAALALGMLGDGILAGGLRLDADLARTAVERLAGPLALEVEAVAQGIVTVACAGMADAIREITVERGHDPRDAALVGFGGAGPLLATRLADELEIDRVVIPPLAGNFSAWGLLGAPRRREAAQTLAGPLDAATLAAALPVADGLLLRLRAAQGEDGVRIAVDVRYRGQEQAVSVPLPPGLRLDAAGAPQALDAAFREAFRRLYLHEFGGPLEVIGVHVAVEQATPPPRLPDPAPAATQAAPRRCRAFSHSRSEWLEFALVERPLLAVGEQLRGPAIVQEQTATTYVDAGFKAGVLPGGVLLLEREAAG